MATKKNKKNKKLLVLLDAHAIIHRAYHALPDFSTKDGRPTGALYGLITMILAILDDFSPNYIAACFDLPKKTFRHELYREYKGTRQKTDDSLKIQLQEARKVCQALNIPIYDHEGYEADDVLGTIAEQYKGSDEMEIIIASGDMDTLQLANNKHVSVFTLKRGIKDTALYDEKGVTERFGFSPSLIPDYKGLRGDPSDNIIGVKGIGEKTATTLITTFGTLENIYEQIERDEQKIIAAGVTPRMISLLKEHREDAEFSKTLATIRRDAPVVYVEPKEDWIGGLDKKNVQDIFRDYEFRSLWTRFDKKFFSDDTRVDSDKDITIGGSSPDNKKQRGKLFCGNIDEEDLRRVAIALWLTNTDMTHPSYEDIMLATGADDFETAKKKVFDQLDAEGLRTVFDEIEEPLIPIMEQMQKHGILIDVPFLLNFSKDLHKEILSIEKKIHTLAGTEFNIRSPKQLQEVLFSDMDLPTKGIKKTASGGYSTQESELEKLLGEHEIIELIMQHREVSKLASTYVDVVPTLVDDRGRLHPELLQDGTATGRFSSQNPNIQNIPIRTELGKNIRKAFIAPKDFSLVAIDYSQIELRIAAMISGDEYLIGVFQQGGDIHNAVAARVFDVPPHEVTDNMRRKAKVINFGILYGMGVSALQKNLGSDRKEAQDFLNTYFERLPSIKKYIEDTKHYVHKHSYTETLFGRKRYLPSIRSGAPFVRAMAERMAINAPIQGTSADIIKLAMKHVDHYLEQHKLKDKVIMIMQIHDELVFEIHNSVLATTIVDIQNIMEHVFEDSYLQQKPVVPIKVSVKVGINLFEVKDWTID